VHAAGSERSSALIPQGDYDGLFSAANQGK
jgi:hypothetical protein